MKRLIAIGLGVDHPVAHTVGVQAVEVGYRTVYGPAEAFFIGTVIAVKYDAHGVQVIYLLEGYMLLLHLAPYRVDGFHTGLGLVGDALFAEFFLHGRYEVAEHVEAMLLRVGDIACYLSVGFRMLIFEAQVLELGLDGIEAEPVSQRGVDVKRFACYLVLLVDRHGAEGTHVVQAVGHFDQYHTYILAHGKQELTEIFGLGRCLVAENTSGYLCQP